MWKEKTTTLQRPRSETAERGLSWDVELTVMKNRCSSEENKDGRLWKPPSPDDTPMSWTQTDVEEDQVCVKREGSVLTSQK